MMPPPVRRFGHAARMRAAAAAAALLLAIAAAAPGTAQEAEGPASLVADRIFAEGDRLVAEGAVEVLHGTSRLSAARVTYDRAADRLTIEGPIRLTTGPESILLADAAVLDPELERGIMLGARLVLDRQLQLAANEIQVAGDVTGLTKVAATSCTVCGTEAPIWQIRARRVVHDATERQLYFEGAELRIFDFPVFYLPRLRLPDPTLERATGFLIPELRTTSQLGTGLKWPYFVRLGEHADLTLTPYLSPETRTLELRYRQAFRNGTVEANAAVTRDDILPDRMRAYFFGEGAFVLPRGYRLAFDVEAVEDDSYLLDYGYSGKDRLDSALTLARTGRDRTMSASLVGFQTLREDEDDALIPTIVADYRLDRRLFPAGIGGELLLSAAAHGHYRYSDEAAGGAGRDMARASARAEWRRDWILGPGLVAEAVAALHADAWSISQDDTQPASEALLAPYAAASLAWPLVGTGRDGASHVIEPRVQLLVTPEDSPGVPNEDSTQVEFDEGNLFALSRYPGADLAERGARADIGLTWTRIGLQGLDTSLTFGRVFRPDTPNPFTATSGLAGMTSDWLVAGQITTPEGLHLTARGLFDAGLDFSKAEARADWQFGRLGTRGTYTWLVADEEEDRETSASELALGLDYRIADFWTTGLDWRYDFVTEETAEARLGVGYRNECIAVRFSVSRRFTSSATVDPSTDFGLTVSLLGFGAEVDGRPMGRRCDGDTG